MEGVRWMGGKLWRWCVSVGGGGGKLLGVAHIGGEVGWEGGKLCEWPMSVGDGKPQG